MLSYRHGYHAGNFADVHKHVVLALLLEALRRKESPFFVLDTHAGAGLYDLGSGHSQKLREYADGIGRLWPPDAEGVLPGICRTALQTANPGGRLARYPGSPALIREALRPGDRAAFVERHPADLAALKAFAAGDSRIGVHARDGFEALVALLPPREKRGLALIDPPYEVKGDYRRVVETLKRAHGKWPSGCYALWYPMLDQPGSERMVRDLGRSGIRKILRTELRVRNREGGPGMHGSGMLVVNPPWQLDARLASLLPGLARILAPASGESRVDWMVPE